MKYKVLIVIKDKWYSDQREFATHAEARKHQLKIAKKWNTSETAIARSSDVMSYREAEKWLADLKAC